MEQFLSITTTSDRLLASRLCEAIEEAGIAVMLEHVDLIEQGIPQAGYRLLVPSHCTETARRLLSRVEAGYVSRAQLSVAARAQQSGRPVNWS